jgi:hypothetical protein
MPFQSVHCPIQVPPQYVEPYKHLDPNRQEFAGMLAALDEAVGQVQQGLAKKDMWQQTLTVFSSTLTVLFSSSLRCDSFARASHSCCRWQRITAGRWARVTVIQTASVAQPGRRTGHFAAERGRTTKVGHHAPFANLATNLTYQPC